MFEYVMTGIIKKTLASRQMLECIKWKTGPEKKKYRTAVADPKCRKLYTDTPTVMTTLPRPIRATLRLFRDKRTSFGVGVGAAI